MTWFWDCSWLISARTACLPDSVDCALKLLHARASSDATEARADCSDAIWPRICPDALESRARPA